LFRGSIRVFSNSSTDFVGSVALLEEKGQVAGVELKDSHLMCHHPAYQTHLQGILLIVHPDNFTSVVSDPFDPEHVTDYIRLESELSFLHVKTSLSQRDKLRQVKLRICETRRELATTWLESIAGTENLLVNVFGRGHLVTKSGATVYVTKCWPVSVTPRAVVNCTSEIPVTYNGSAVFVDPISYVIKLCASVVKCNDSAPPPPQVLNWGKVVLLD
jgi:hypothetical protein